MSAHLQREITKLQRHILALGAEVEEDVRSAVRSVEHRDNALAETVLRREPRTNALEVDVEEECLKLLALYQPVAADLRYIVAVLKINQDLERIGDLAVHIAECALALGRLPAAPLSARLGEMGDRVEVQLKHVLDAFVDQDADAARRVCADDRFVDELRRLMFSEIRDAMLRTPEQFESLMRLMNISRHLERIADHATNIAEDLIYLIEGRIVRHTPEVSDHPAVDQEGG